MRDDERATDTASSPRESLVRRRRLPALISVPVTLAIVSGGTAAAYFSLQGSHQAPATSLPAKDPEITTSGSLDGLYPGAERTVRVTVRNPNPYPIALDKIDAFSAKTRSGCPAYAVESKAINPGTLHVTLEPSGQQSLPLTVFLNTWAGNECAGQTFALTFRVYASSRS